METRELIGPFANKKVGRDCQPCTYCNSRINERALMYMYKQRRTDAEIASGIPAKKMIVVHDYCIQRFIDLMNDSVTTWTTKKAARFHSSSQDVAFNSPEPPAIGSPVNNQPVTPNEDLQTMTNASNDNPLAKAILDAIGPYLQSKVSPDDVRGIFDDMFSRAFQAVKNDIQSKVTHVEVTLPDATKIDCGIQHCKFPSLLKRASARKACDGNLLNWWLYGPAGSGKTRLTLEIAKALQSPRYFATGSIVDTSIIFGHKNPLNGEYYRTAFRDVWEFGGDAVFDDFSGSDPVLAVELLGVLGNSVACFPDGMIERHRDCRLWFADNTTGNGSTASYNGRFKMDAALVNRFTYFEIPYDDDLEISISGNEKWAKKVQAYRKLASQKEIKCIISPRQSIDGAALLAIGIPEHEVLEDVIAPRMSSTQWDSIKGLVK